MAKRGREGRPAASQGPATGPHARRGFSEAPGTSYPPVANPIAVRRYGIVGEPEREVVLTIGEPRPDPDPASP